MRVGVFVLLCGLSTGCSGGDTPARTSAGAGGGEAGGTSHTIPASTNPGATEAEEPAVDEPVGLRCEGTVVSSQESPQNKRFPERGGHWIVELEIEEWSAADESEQPGQPLRLIVPREVVQGLAQAPVAGERFAVVAKLVSGRTDAARVDSLSPLAAHP